VGDFETFATRCGYKIRRAPINRPGSRVCIDTPAGTWYLDAAIYDETTDDEFEQLANAWLTGDCKTVDDLVEDVRERHPGLTSLRQASDRHERDRAVELAIAALQRRTPAGVFMAGHSGATTSDFTDSIIDVAMRLGDYIKNGFQ
jgi:hypothetical protein